MPQKPNRECDRVCVYFGNIGPAGGLGDEGGDRGREGGREGGGVTYTYTLQWAWRVPPMHDWTMENLISLSPGSGGHVAAGCGLSQVLHLPEPLRVPGTLCPSKGLLFVPLDIDRGTVELRLGGNYILRITQQDFANMTDLVDLTLYIQPFSFGDLETLRSLHLDNNRLTELGPDDLRGLVNLQHLILGRIHDKALEDLAPALEDLDLSYNNLPLAALGTRLDHNLLDFIPEGTFADLERLARLDLTSNRLRKLPPDAIFARAQDYYSSSSVTPPSLSATPFGPPPLSLSLGGTRCTATARCCGCGGWSATTILETSPAGRRSSRQHTHRMLVLEGQTANLRCEAAATGAHGPLDLPRRTGCWANSSRTAVFANGTLSITITTAKDYGTFTCIAANVAGESAASVEATAPAPAGQPAQQPKSRLSDITGTSRAGKGAPKGPPEKVVTVTEVTAVSALIQWTVTPAAPKVKMYQLQYNCSETRC
ncbi:hypothetical protein CRUP_022263 [Coryphaenoides rupestris]|nr:hypothetical protein CRUP_022263 [Coryphaenoides rupestris]